MKKLLLVAFTVGLSAVCSAITVVEVGADTTHELTTSENSDAYRFEVSQGGVLKLPATASGLAVSCYIYCTGGDAVVDCTAVEGDVRFASYVKATDGNLVIKGKSGVKVGVTLPSNDTFYSCARWNVPNISFVDAEGAPIAAPDGVRFTGVVAPETLSGLEHVEQGSCVMFNNTAVVALVQDADGNITIDDGYYCFFMAKGAMPTTEPTITVKAGGKLRFKGLNFKDADTPSLSARGDQTYPRFHIVMDTTGATAEKSPKLIFSDNKTVYYDATLTGGGDISLAVGGSNDSLNSRQWIAGPVTNFTGSVAIPNGLDRLTLGVGSGVTLTGVTGGAKALLALLSGTHDVDNSAVTVEQMSAGMDVAAEPMVSLTLPQGVRTVAIDDGRLVHHVATAGMVDYSKIRFDTDRPVLLATDATSAAGLPDDQSVRVTEGASVSLTMGAEGRVIAVDAGSTATLACNSWQSAAALWLDPCRTDLIGGLGSRIMNQTVTYQDAYRTAYGDDMRPLNTRRNGMMLIEYIKDCREGHTYAGYISRLYHNNGISKQVQVYMISNPNGPNGCSFFDSSLNGYTTTEKIFVDEVGSGTTAYKQSMVDVRRLPFSPEIKAKTVIMVYGSQNGGGTEIIGTKGKVLLREDGLDNPIVSSGDFDAWVDGEKKDLTQTCFNGDWQVISVKLPSTTLYGLGYSDGTYNNCGNQYWGDVLVYTNDLADVERVAAEKTLAAKWGITYKGGAVAAAGAQLTGTGTVEIEDDMVFAGNFAGTLRLANGAKLTIPSEAKLPYGVGDIPTENLVGWYDPNEISTVIFNKGTPLEIVRIKDRTGGSKPTLYGSGCRAPHAELGARGTGPSMTWVDYNDLMAYRTGSAGYQGNVMRLVPTPTSSTQQAYDVQTGFIVQDSSRGGGTPFACDIDSKGKKTVAIRQTNYPETQIYSANTMAALQNGGIWLDGQTRANADGFTGRPEVFAFEAKDTTIPLLCFGAYYNSEGDKDAYFLDSKTVKGSWVGEVQGEILLYSTALSDEVRDGINAYLMGKWLGRLPAGYVDPRAMTVTGSGSVDAPSAAMLPKFAADFAGTVAAADGDMAFTLADGALSGAFDFGNGTYEIPADSTVTVDFPTRRKLGKYVLLSAGSLTGDVPQLVITGDEINVGDRGRISLAIEDNKLVLNVAGAGLMLMVR